MSERAMANTRSTRKTTSSRRRRTAAAKPSRKGRPTSPSERPSWGWRLLRVGFMLGVALFICGALGLAILFYVFSQDLPEILERDDFKPPQMTRIVSSEGHVIDELYVPEGRRTVVAFEAISGRSWLKT